MKHFRIWMILLAFAPLFPVLSQAPAKTAALDPSKSLQQYVLDVWTKKDGLPSRTLTGLLQSSDGYLWLSSFNGIYRFDGIASKAFTGKEYPLLERNIFGFSAEHRGRIYIGAGEKGLLYHENGEIKQEGEAEGIFLKQVQSLVFEDDKTWIGTRGAGLYTLENGEIKPYHDERLRNVSISQIIKDEEGRIWFGTEGNGLLCLEDGAIRAFGAADGLESKLVSTMYLGPDGKLWIGMQTGLYYLDDNNRIQMLSGTDGFSINSLYIDGYNSIWIAAIQGLLRVNPHKDEVEYFGEESGLPHRNVSDVIGDTEGSLWIATYQSGLARLKDSQFSNYTTRNGLSSRALATVCKLDEKRLLVGTASGKMHLIDNGKVSDFIPKTKLQSTRVKHLYRDSQQNLYISTYAGLLVIHPDGTETLHNTSTGFPDDRTRMAFEDSKGNMWIGTRSGGAVCIAPDGSYDLWNTKNGKLTSDFIMSIDQDKEGRIIIGTNDDGINILGTDSLLEHITITEGLSSNLIFNVYVDEQHDMWVTTNVGINKISSSGIAHLTEAKGLPANAVYDVMEDALGNMWITSNLGLIQVPKASLIASVNDPEKELQYRVYNSADGMPADECMGATQSVIGLDDKMYIPTLGGLAVFDPNRKISNDLRPPVHIDAVIVDGVSHNVNKKIVLPADTKRVTFYYTALSLLAPQNVQFKYLLEGYDPDWVEAGTERQAVYTGLPSGEHTFRVIASNNNNIWNEEGASYTLYRTPFIYEEPWFYAVIFILVAGLGLVFYRYRVNAIESKNKELEMMVSKRTGELVKQKNKVELAYKDLNTVSTIGQEVTAILDIDKLILTVYERVKTLMSADMFGIGIYDDEKQHINFRALIKNGELLPNHIEQISDEFYLSVRCFNSQQDIVINDAQEEYKEYGEYLKATGKTMQDETTSVIYVPLLIEGKSVGVLTVQSNESNAYLSQHLTILKALASYISVAMENSKSYEIIETNNRHITNSLRYAETIQDAVLPNDDDLANAFESYFVMYKPKDIVSGDFYWMKEVGDKIFVVVSDCTGHGVPGAFMSMIGISLLNEIVMVKGVYSPASILEDLHDEIHDALQQENSGNQDGMDISICCIQKNGDDEFQITYAGAKQKILYTKQGEMLKVSGDKRGIGGLSGRNHTPFTDKSWIMPKGEVLYMFSDGLIDQHSPSGKRMGSPKFYKILEEHLHKPLKEQGLALEQELTGFQQYQHQRDDITVMGLKL